MSCEVIKVGGGTAIVCTRGQRRRRCSFCSIGNGEFQCDAPKAGAATCDAFMCGKCRRPFVVEGKKLDFCPPCARTRREQAQLAVGERR